MGEASLEANQENKREEKPSRLRQNWKRILLLSLFFSILFISLFNYILLPRILDKPLRHDPIPTGSYQIPWMKPSPPIEELEQQIPGSPPPFDTALVMDGALKLNMIFRIDIPGGIRVVPSTVYLGHDSNYLYVGGEFTGMYTNPASTPNGTTVPNYFAIFFDVDNDGLLKQPESGSRLSSFIEIPRLTGARFYHDMMWLDYSRSYKHGAWILADNYYEQDLNRVQPAFSVVEMIDEYDNSTGTLTMLFSRFLRLPANSEVNALQMRAGERWVMGFHLEIGYALNAEPGTDYVDGWPQKTYPYTSDDSSWWPKLVIDLTDPPPEFST